MPVLMCTVPSDVKSLGLIELFFICMMEKVVPIYFPGLTRVSEVKIIILLIFNTLNAFSIFTG